MLVPAECQSIKDVLYYIMGQEDIINTGRDTGALPKPRIERKGQHNTDNKDSHIAHNKANQVIKSKHSAPPPNIGDTRYRTVIHMYNQNHNFV